MRHFPGIIAMFVFLLVLLATGVVHAQDATQPQYRLVTNLGAQQTPGYTDTGTDLPFTAIGNVKAGGLVTVTRDAAYAGAREGAAKGAVIRTAPDYVVRSGIADLQEQVSALHDDDAATGSSVATFGNLMLQGLERIEQKLDKSKFPWWGWILLGIALALGLANLVRSDERRIVRNVRDRRYGVDGISEARVQEIVAEAIGDHEDCEDEVPAKGGHLHFSMGRDIEEGDEIIFRKAPKPSAVTEHTERLDVTPSVAKLARDLVGMYLNFLREECKKSETTDTPPAVDSQQ